MISNVCMAANRTRPICHINIAKRPSIRLRSIEHSPLYILTDKDKSRIFTSYFNDFNADHFSPQARMLARLTKEQQKTPPSGVDLAQASVSF